MRVGSELANRKTEVFGWVPGQGGVGRGERGGGGRWGRGGWVDWEGGPKRGAF